MPNVNQDMGPVIVKLWLSDGNHTDEHTLEWDLTEFNLDAPLGDELSFDPAYFTEGEYLITARATDSGENSLFCDIEIKINLVTPIEEEQSNRSGGGALWWITVLLAAALVRRRAVL